LSLDTNINYRENNNNKNIESLDQIHIMILHTSAMFE